MTKKLRYSIIFLYLLKITKNNEKFYKFWRRKKVQFVEKERKSCYNNYDIICLVHLYWSPKTKNTNEYETSRLIGVQFATIRAFCDRMDFEVKNNYPLPLKEV